MVLFNIMNDIISKYNEKKYKYLGMLTEVLKEVYHDEFSIFPASLYMLTGLGFSSSNMTSKLYQKIKVEWLWND